MVGFELLRQKFGDIYGLFVGKVRAVVVSDFDLVQELCSSADWAHRVDFHALVSVFPGFFVKKLKNKDHFFAAVKILQELFCWRGKKV